MVSSWTLKMLRLVDGHDSVKGNGKVTNLSGLEIVERVRENEEELAELQTDCSYCRIHSRGCSASEKITGCSTQQRGASA